MKADFMKIPKDSNTYDAVYAIDATCHAPDAVNCYKVCPDKVRLGDLDCFVGRWRIKGGAPLNCLIARQMLWTAKVCCTKHSKGKTEY